jgi:DNA repair exonuclease SbcCD ATPase subunit
MGKKLEIAKLKLQKKTKELSESEKIIHSLRSTLERIERERTRLASKVTQLNNRISAKDQLSQKDELEKIIAEKTVHITKLEDKMARLENEFSKKMDEERKEYENNISKYESNEKTLQDLNAKLESKIMKLESSREQISNLSDDMESSVKSDGLQENFIKELNEKCKRLEKEKLNLESDLLELKLEKERLSTALMKKETALSHIPPQELPLLPKKRTDYKGKTSNELLQVIDQLSRAIEKVKAENEALKKSAINPIKHQEALRDVKKLRDELEKATDERKNADLYARQSSRYSCVIPINTRLEEENSKTQKLYKKEVLKTGTLSSEIQELKLNNEALKKELILIRRNIGTDGVNLETVDELRSTIKNLQADISKNVILLKTNIVGRKIK